MQRFLLQFGYSIAALASVTLLLFIGGSTVGWSATGTIFGIIVGSFAIGGLVGWGLNRLLRVPYPWADLLSLAVLVFAAGYTNSSADRSVAETWLLYGTGAFFAYVLLTLYHRARPRTAVPARIEPTFGAPSHGAQTTDIRAEVGDDSARPTEPSLAIPLTSVASSSTRTTAKWNVILRHWRGEFSLAVSYWAIGFLGNVVVALALVAVSSTFSMDTGYEPTLIFGGLCFAWILAAAVLVWQVVGLWRSAERRAVENHRNGRRAFWSRVAQVMAVLGVLEFMSTFAATGEPELGAMWRVAFEGDPDIPAVDLRLSPDGQTLVLNGGIKYGLAGNIETILDAAPQVKSLELTSPGGRISEAIKVFDVIRSRHLNTLVPVSCASACTMIFVAGQTRLLAQGALLGFHGSYFPGLTKAELETADDQWAAVFKSAGIESGFVQKALAVSPSDIWSPTRDELVAAGVLSGSPADVAALPPDFKVVPTIDSIRAELRATSPLFDAIDQVAPEDAARIYAFGQQYASGSLDIATFQSDVRTAVGTIVRSRIPLASDDSLKSFASLVAAEYGAVLKQDPVLCFKFASGVDPSFNVTPLLPADLVKAELNLDEQIVRTAAPRVPVSEDVTGPMLQDAYGALKTEFTADQLRLIGISPNLVQPADYANYCLVTIGLFQEIANLPVDRSAMLMRAMFK